MATIKLQGSSGGGSVTLTAPVTAANRTITLPDQDIDFGNISGEGSVKAWATYSMSGTPSLTAEGGMSSITDLGTGTPQFNLDIALPAVNGSPWSTSSVYSNGAYYPVQTGARVTSTTAYQVYCGSSATTRDDWQIGYTGLVR